MADDWVAVGAPAAAAKADDDWQAVPAAPEQPSRFSRFMSGMRDPMQAMAQIEAHVLPQPAIDAINLLRQKTGAQGTLTPRGFDRATAEREQSLEAAGAGPLDPYRLGGNVAATVPLSALGAIGGGAAAGALTPVADGNFWGEKAKQTALGAAGGKVTELAGNALARVIRPVTDTAKKLLVDAGVRLTPGQLAGGLAKSSEDRFTSLPFTGDAISAGERRSIEDFNRAAYNRALAPIGQKYTDEAVGREGVGKVESLISAEYDKIKPRLTFVADTDFKTALGKLDQAATELPDGGAQFRAILQNRVLKPLAEDSDVLNGERFKTVESELSTIARKYSGSADAGHRELSSMLNKVGEAMRDGLERANPADAPELRKINAAWAAFKRIQSASINRGTSGGVFTPGDLLAGVKKLDASRSKGVFARGDALLQDLAEAGQSVLPNKVPDSGTAGRTAHMSATSLLTGVLGLLPAMTAYGERGANFLRAYAGMAPQTRNMLAKATQQGAAVAAPGSGAAAANALTSVVPGL